MRFAIVSSVLLHVGAFMLAYLSLPDFRDNPLVEVIIPVQILNEAEIAEETSVPETVAQPAPEQDPEPEPEEAPVPVPVEPEPEPEPVSEPEDPVPPLPEPEEQPVEEAPEPEPEPVEPEPAPEPEPVQPEPQQEPEPDNLDLDFLEEALKDLTPDQPGADPREVPNAVPGERNQDRIGLGQQLTATEYDRIKAHIESRCWNTQSFIGAPEPEKLVVRVEFVLNRDGTLVGNPQVLNQTQIAISGNPFWRVAERAAITAVRECAPYDFLPENKYEAWREIILNFNPSEMAGL
ncbi:cell envelope integrity protein TolA [Parvularcula sp. IMCC14364]|uniref:cell envelope integrity protein TolA n=1 Tax=Parvularcula sp. IMCC14364 TaxID=3067902 RepID=UPI0027414A59|nr:cell envelope integrity protein TolA [Parvularcula sp. IMCC14364]